MTAKLNIIQFAGYDKADHNKANVIRLLKEALEFAEMVILRA